MEPQDKIHDKIPQVDPYSGEANRALQEAGDRADTVRPPSLATASPSREAVHLPGPAGEGGPASTSYPPAWHLSGSPGPRRRDRGPRQPCPTSAVRYPAFGAGRELRGHLHHPPRHLLSAGGGRLEAVGGDGAHGAPALLRAEQGRADPGENQAELKHRRDAGFCFNAA